MSGAVAAVIASLRAAAGGGGGPLGLISAIGVNWAAAANPAGQAITVPAGASAAYMFWTFSVGSAGQGLLSATLAGAAPAQTHETASLANFAPACGVAVWYNPPAGSQTLDPAWDIAPAEGPACIVAFVQGGNASAWRSAGSDRAAEQTAVSTTIATQTGDLVLKFDQRFDSVAGSFPFTSAGWTSGATAENNLERARLSFITAAGATQVCNSENEDYSSVVAVAIPAA